MSRLTCALPALLAALFGLVQAAAAATICFEAELADELDFPFGIAEAQGASGELALCAPEGSGSAEAMGERRSTAIYHIGVPEDGKYIAWLRVRWNGVCSNSVFFHVGDAKQQEVADSLMDRWHWVPAGTWALKAGTTELRILNREDGIMVDQVALSTDNLNPGDAPLKANVTPARSDRERAPVRLFAGTGREDGQIGPKPDFYETHSPTQVNPLPPVNTVMLRSGQPATVKLWLRAGDPADASGKVSVHTEAPVDLRPGAEQPFTIPAGTNILGLAFELSARKDTPRRAWPLFARLHHADGRIEAQEMLLVRPFQWLVTGDLPCPETSGIETPAAMEAGIGRGFPGNAGGLRWRLAPEEATTPLGLLDMRKAVADKTYVMAYAYTALECPEPGDHLLEIRHDDMIRVWLNGEPVFTGTHCAPSDLTRSLAKVNLRRGTNHLLVKIAQRRNFWEFGIRVLTLKGGAATVTGGEVSHLASEK